MAQKKGMTPTQARYALMDSVLNVNFMTGPANPKWLKDPYIRTMMLFQGTPFKILEQRAVTAWKGGKGFVGASQEVMRQLRADVKEGESRFKTALIKDALTKDKDMFGTAYSGQLVKQLMVLGTVIGGGKAAFDADLFGHAVHIPGLKLNEKGAELGLNPVLGAGWQTATGANIKDEDPEEFWISRFLNTWLTGKGAPAIVNKAIRLNNDDIPAMYKDSKLSYLFGVPKTKDE
jgi:hypothetical protein